MGYPTALTAPEWGFQDVVFKEQEVTLARPLDAYVMENVLFKVAFPAEFHAQTAAEAAVQLKKRRENRSRHISRKKNRYLKHPWLLINLQINSNKINQKNLFLKTNDQKF